MGYDSHHEDDGHREETPEQQREKSEADVLQAARVVGWFLPASITALNVETMKRVALQLERFAWFEQPHLLVATLPVARLRRAWDDYTERDGLAAKIAVEAEREVHAEWEQHELESRP